MDHFGMASWQPEFKVKFSQQPPACHRKSTFFSFKLDIKCKGLNYMTTEAKFLGFVKDFGELENQNGLQYSFVYAWDGGYSYLIKKYFYVWLVDSETNELIKYEGKKNFDALNRVLLIHSHYCERCVSNAQSCGNNTEKPKDPTPNPKKTEWKFSMRFNQNCQTTSGNPTDKKKRQFRLLVTMSDSDKDKGVEVARSNRIIVHNNSKKAKDMLAIDNLLPQYGYPGSSLVVCGKYFDKDTTLFVGGKPVPTTRPANSTTILQAMLPDFGESCPMSVVLKKKDRFVESPTPLLYYNNSNHSCFPSLDCQFCKSVKLMAPMFLDGNTMKSRMWQSDSKIHHQRQQLMDWHVNQPSMNSPSGSSTWTDPVTNGGYSWQQGPISRNPSGSSPQLNFSGFPDPSGISEMSPLPPSQASYVDLANTPNQGNSQRMQNPSILQYYQHPCKFIKPAGVVLP
ncbi:Transcription factor collier [Araneus ventricosus]|uniref:Transcription factor collier n=1 Tax=Araneus ventricosus TaxID=182803 RepID=A0A4Y2FPC1_ARAVE|nr:Transcription factor collier [Araneus ventricosus]